MRAAPLIEQAGRRGRSYLRITHFARSVSLLERFFSRFKNLDAVGAVVIPATGAVKDMGPDVPMIFRGIVGHLGRKDRRSQKDQ